MEKEQYIKIIITILNEFSIEEKYIINIKVGNTFGRWVAYIAIPVCRFLDEHENSREKD